MTKGLSSKSEHPSFHRPLKYINALSSVTPKLQVLFVGSPEDQFVYDVVSPECQTQPPLGSEYSFDEVS